MMNFCFPVKYLKLGQGVYSFALTVITAFFPKCAFCWTAYASIFSSLGFSTVVFSEIKLLYPALIGLLALNIYSMWVVAKEREAYTSLNLSIIGIGILIVQRFIVNEPMLSYFGILFISTGSIINYISGNLRCRVVGK